MHKISLKDLYKSYTSRTEGGRRIEVFSGFNLDIEPGEFVTLFGGNGCGKTTLLNIIAGLIPYESGHLEVGRQEGEKAQVGYIFQHYEASLFPWYNILDNIAFPLEIKGLPQKKRREMVRAFLKDLQIDLPLEANPYQVSGGQKQLIAIARALIYSPDILLMDEPFSALDYGNRLYMQEQILRIWRKTGISVLFVSHAPEEAVYLGDRCVLLDSKLPTSVLKEIKIDLPRPRTHDLKRGKAFLDSLAELITIFGELHGKRI